MASPTQLRAQNPISLDPPPTFGKPEQGVVIEGGIVTEFFAPLQRGGRGHTHRTWINLHAELDFDALLSIPGSAFVIDGQANFQGGDLDVGDVQMISLLDAPNSYQFAEVYLQQQFFANDALLLRAGVIDANSEFAAMDAIGNFMNSSPGTTPTLAELPTWPATAPGIEAVITTEHGLSVAAGVYDKSNFQVLANVPSGRVDARGTYGIVEARYELETETTWTRLSVGGWHDTDIATEDDGVTEDSFGQYVMVEHDLPAPWSSRNDTQLRLFATLGRNDSPVTVPVKRHMLFGGEWTNPFERNEGDSIGLMASRVDLNRSAELEARGAETTIETYCHLHFGERFDFTTSLQYIDQVSGSGDEALVLGFRATFAF